MDSEKRLLVNAKDKSSLSRIPPLDVAKIRRNLIQWTNHSQKNAIMSKYLFVQPIVLIKFVNYLTLAERFSNRNVPRSLLSTNSISDRRCRLSQYERLLWLLVRNHGKENMEIITKI